MNLIISTVQQEKQRIDYMLVNYQKALAELPKGTISEKQVNGNTYYYLKYRAGKKTIWVYGLVWGWKKDYFQVHREKRNRKTETTD